MKIIWVGLIYSQEPFKSSFLWLVVAEGNQRDLKYKEDLTWRKWSVAEREETTWQSASSWKWHWLIASKAVGTLVSYYKEVNSANNPRKHLSPVRTPDEYSPGWHLGFSFLRPWVEDQLKSAGILTQGIYDIIKCCHFKPQNF